VKDVCAGPAHNEPLARLNETDATDITTTTHICMCALKKRYLSAGADLCSSTIHICLFFLAAVIPLIINPFAADSWYLPKIQSVYGLLIIILGALSVRTLVLKQPLHYRPIPLAVPLALYAASAVVSTVFSAAPALSLWGDAFREESLFACLSYAALTFLFSQLASSERQLHGFLKGLLGAGALVSLYGMLNYAGYYPLQFDKALAARGPGVGSLTGNANFLGKFLVLVLPLFLACFFTAPQRQGRILFGAGFLMCTGGLLVSFTRATWLGAAVALAAMRLLAGREKLSQMGRPLLFLVCCCTAAAAVCWGLLSGEVKGKIAATVQERFRSAVVFHEGRGGAASRLFVWRRSLGLIKQRPLFGYGPDAHMVAMRAFNLEYCLRFNDWTRAENKEGKETIRFYNWTVLDRAHNNYLDMAISQGLFGLAAYLSVVVTFMVWLWRVLRTEADSAKKLFFCGIFAAFCGCLTNDLFVFSTVSVSPAFWSLMGITLAMKRLSVPGDRQPAAKKQFQP